MAYARKCDRCGRMYPLPLKTGNPYEDNAVRLARVTFDNSVLMVSNGDVKDLCLNCMNSFMEWLEAEKNDKIRKY